MTVEEDAAMQVRMAKRVYRKEGLEEGRKEGRAEGRAEAEKRYGELVSRLLADGRLDDLKHVAEDPSLLEGLYEELGI